MLKEKIKINFAAIIDEPGNSIKNKTGGWRSIRPVWHKEKCIQCMKCWEFCPDIAIPQKKGKRTETDFNFCKGCGICAQVCPVKCIEMVPEQK
jgi:pyruvate ferredoxin oxidoreductase delta subunit